MERFRKFSFIEMLITITMILILLGLISAALNMAREKARRVSSINNLKNIGIALTIYSSCDPFESYPDDGLNNANGTIAGSLALLKDNIQIPATLIDPSSGRSPSPEWDSNMNCDFVYLHSSVSTMMLPDSGIVANHTGTHDNYGSILYSGGYVLGYSGANWNSEANIKNPGLKPLTE